MKRFWCNNELVLVVDCALICKVSCFSPQLVVAAAEPKSNEHTQEQLCPDRGWRAACGPVESFVRPCKLYIVLNIQYNDNMSLVCNPKYHILDAMIFSGMQKYFLLVIWCTNNNDHYFHYWHNHRWEVLKPLSLGLGVPGLEKQMKGLYD